MKIYYWVTTIMSVGLVLGLFGFYASPFPLWYKAVITSLGLLLTGIVIICVKGES